MTARMPPKFALLLFLVKTAVLMVTATPSSSCPSRALCVVQPALLPTSSLLALQTLQQSLCGCTTIDGSIAIDLSTVPATPDSTSTQLTASNFSFLEQVQEVTGYLELKGVRVADKLSLPSLTVIHGRELKNGRALVIDSVVAPAGVTFPILSEIVTGDAYFSGVSGVCGYANVNWSDILSNGTLQEGNTSACVQVSGDCSACQSAHCWSPGSSEGGSACQTSLTLPYYHIVNGVSLNSDSCGCLAGCIPCGVCVATLTRTVCPASCGGNRCFLTADNATLECCDPRCVGGCSGVTASDCFACSSFSDGGVCVRACSNEYVYNSEDRSVTLNTEHNLRTGYFCVNTCPAGLYAKDGVCVADCGDGFNVTSEGECVPRADQPKVCPGMNLAGMEHLSKDNVDLFSGCTAIDGHFAITALTSEAILRGQLSEDQLNELLSIKEIRGSLVIFNYGRMQLSFLQNVEVIGSHSISPFNPHDFGAGPSRNVSLYIGSNQRLLSIDMPRLRQIVSGDVYLSTNDRLCYVPNFSLFFNGSHGQQYVNDTASAYRRDPAACALDGLVCHAQCDPSGGCSGSTAGHCVRCAGYRDTTSNQCVSSCSEIQGVYSNESSRTCEPCHEECTACSGPSQYNCTSCKNLEVAPSVSSSLSHRLCVAQCPVGLGVSGRSCEPCSEHCKVEEGCTGSTAVVGSGGCFSCDTVLFQDSVIQCVSSCPPQYYRDVLTSASGPIVVGTGVCRPCSRGCTSCSGPLPSQCSQCAGVGLRHANGSLECVNTCPNGTYMDPSTMMCEACDTVCDCCASPLTDYCNACMGLQSESCASGCVTTGEMNDSGNGTESTTTTAPPVEYSTIVEILVPCVTAVLLVTLMVTLVCCLWCCCKRSASKEQTYCLHHPELASDVPHCFANKCCVFNMPMRWTIPGSKIDKQQKLVDGPHASVYKGTLFQDDSSNKEVAIKELKASLDVNLEHSSVAELLSLSDLAHYHLVRFYGVSPNGSISIVSEFVPGGPLDAYLQDNAATVSGGDMLNYALQVAKGMFYLESQQIVHGGLALRNILVHSPVHVKISDLGWTQVVQQGYTDVLAPVRWLPSECIIGQARPFFFSSQSEVWAFGVLLWEMLTYGEYPYANWATAESVALQVTTLGARLPRPEACSTELGTLMEKCWDRDSSLRPTFAALEWQLSDMTRSPDSFIDPDKLPRERCVRTRRPMLEPFSIEDMSRTGRVSVSPDSGRHSALSLQQLAADIMPCERLV